MSACSVCHYFVFLTLSLSLGYTDLSLQALKPQKIERTIIQHIMVTGTQAVDGWADTFVPSSLYQM